MACSRLLVLPADEIGRITTLPWPRARDDVRSATQKSVVPRSARRLASSEAAPAVLDGSQNDLQATDGPLPQPRTRDDVRVATQKSVVQPCPSPRELRGPCDLPQCSPNSVSMALLV